MGINRETMELLHLILQTLIKTCVDNYSNRQVIYNRQIMDVINRILQLGTRDHQTHAYHIADVRIYLDLYMYSTSSNPLLYSLFLAFLLPSPPSLFPSIPPVLSPSKCVNLKHSAVELMEVMLEGTSSNTQELAKEIAVSLDLDAVHNTIGDFYALMIDSGVRQAKFQDKAERGLFQAYHILVHLQDYGISLGKWGEEGAGII